MGRLSISAYVANACTTSGIGNISTHKNALEAMTDLCERELGKNNVVDRWGGAPKSTYKKLVSFYVFTAGPEGGKDDGHSHHDKPHWPAYGTDFCKFIRANKLGKVVTCGKKLNLKHHDETTNETWLWSPNQERMEAWWTRRQKQLDTLATKSRKGYKLVKSDPIKVRAHNCGLLTTTPKEIEIAYINGNQAFIHAEYGSYYIGASTEDGTVKLEVGQKYWARRLAYDYKLHDALVEVVKEEWIKIDPKERARERRKILKLQREVARQAEIQRKQQVNLAV